MLLPSAHLFAEDYVTKRRFTIGWRCQFSRVLFVPHTKSVIYLFFIYFFYSLEHCGECIDVTVAMLLKPKMDIQKQDPELNEGAHLVSSLKELRAHIKYEEHADITAFPLIVCDDRVSMFSFSMSVVIAVFSAHTHTHTHIFIYLKYIP